MSRLFLAATLALTLAACGSSSPPVGTGGAGGSGGSGGSGGAGGSGGSGGTGGADARCGDGVRQGAEACDGADLAGASCQSQGHASGTLACTAQCAFDASGCQDDTCSTAADCSKPACATASMCVTLKVLSPPATARVDGGVTLIVAVKTAAGDPVPGISVTVDAPVGAGTSLPVTSDSKGQSRVTVYMGRSLGAQTFTARAGGDGGPTAEATITAIDPPAGYIHTVVNIDHVVGSDSAGSAITAQVGEIVDLAVAGDGTLYLAEACRVLAVSPAGVLSHLAGTGTCGTDDASGAALDANLGVDGMALDEAHGMLLLADGGAGRVRALDLTAGTIHTVAGGGTRVGAAGDGSAATSAQLTPRTVTLGPDGQMYLGDEASESVRRIDAQGVIHTFMAGTTAGDSMGCAVPVAMRACEAGCGAFFDAAGQLYLSTRVCGTQPGDGTVDPSGTTYGLLRIAAGKAVHVAGQAGGPLASDVRGTDGKFPGPLHTTFDKAGNALVVSGSDLFRIDSATGWSTELAGIGIASADGEQAALGPKTGFSSPGALAFGPGGDLYIADTKNASVRRVVAFGQTEAQKPHLSIAGGDGATGTIGQELSRALQFKVLSDSGVALGGQKVVVQPLEPSAVALAGPDADDKGNLSRSVVLGLVPGPQVFQPMLPDIHGGLSPTAESFTLTAQAPDAGILFTAGARERLGLPTAGSALPSLALNATFVSMATDPDGTLYVSGSCSVLRIRAGVADLVAGAGCGDDGDGGPATAATLDAGALALDSAGGRIYVAGAAGGARVRVIDLATGTISAFAGGGSLLRGQGDGGPATDASFGIIQGLAVDEAGLVYVPDASPGAGIRVVDPRTGLIDTFAAASGCSDQEEARIDGAGALLLTGGTAYFVASDCSDQSALIRRDPDGTLHVAVPGSVTALARAPGGGLVVGLQSTHDVESYDPTSGALAAVAGGGIAGGDYLPALQAQLDDIIGLGYDPDGHLYLLQYEALRIVW